MMRELEDSKIIIEQLLKKRSELTVLREQEKIELVGNLDLTNLFSNFSYLSLETLDEVKDVLSKSTNVTNEIDLVNSELISMVNTLKKIKKEIFAKLDLLENTSGKKRTFLRGNKRVSVAEKNYKKYVRFYNATLEIDRLCSLINTIINDDVSLSYNVVNDDLSLLSYEDKMKYYSSLAALIMCDKVLEPASVDIHASVTVDKKNSNTLELCYQGYREAVRSLRKQNKKANLKNKIEKYLTKAKKFVDSLFGIEKDRGVSMALKKSVAVASLSLGLLSSMIAQFNDVVPQKRVEVPLSDDKVISSDVEMIKNFGVYDNEFLSQAKPLDTRIREVTLSTNVASSIRAVDNSELSYMIANKDRSMISRIEENISEDTDTYVSEEIPLDERVEENAYEIVAIVQTNSEQEELTEELVNEESENTYLAESDLTVLQTPASSVIPIATNETINVVPLTGGVDDEIEVESVTPVSAELATDEIVPGFHLTFNNTTYEFNEDEIKAFYYVVKHECNGTYQDALVVTSIIVNRIEDPRYPNDLISVLSAEGQFVVWDDVLKAIAKYGDDFEMEEPIYNALYDCLYRGVRNNDYVEFKASWTSDYSKTGELKVQIAENGNKCHNLAVNLDRTSDDTDTEVVEESEELNTEVKGKILELNL